MTRISDQTGAAITNMEPGKRGTRSYFEVDDVHAGAARVRELGGEADQPDARAEHGLVRDLHGSPRERVRPLAYRPFRPHPERVGLTHIEAKRNGDVLLTISVPAPARSMCSRQPG